VRPKKHIKVWLIVEFQQVVKHSTLTPKIKGSDPDPGTGGLFNKTLRIRNLQKFDRFRNKLAVVSSIVSYKHITLS
jgi:hypothetical protein